MVISTSPTEAGSGVKSGEPGRQFFLQALASSGTVELLFEADGYEPLRVPYVLRPLTLDSASHVLRQGTALQFLLRAPGQIRPGAIITADVSIEPPGIATVEPARIRLTDQTPDQQFTLRGVAPGSATLRITPTSEGLQPSTASVTVLAP